MARLARVAVIAPIAGSLGAGLLGYLAPAVEREAWELVAVTWFFGWLVAVSVLVAASALAGRRWSMGKTRIAAGDGGLCIEGDGGLFIRGGAHVPCAAISGALLVAMMEGVEVEVTTHRGIVYSFDVPSEETG